MWGHIVKEFSIPKLTLKCKKCGRICHVAKVYKQKMSRTSNVFNLTSQNHEDEDPNTSNFIVANWSDPTCSKPYSYSSRQPGNTLDTGGSLGQLNWLAASSNAHLRVRDRKFVGESVFRVSTACRDLFTTKILINKIQIELEIDSGCSKTLIT